MRIFILWAIKLEKNMKSFFEPNFEDFQIKVKTHDIYFSLEHSHHWNLQFSSHLVEATSKFGYSKIFSSFFYYWPNL